MRPGCRHLVFDKLTDQGKRSIFPNEICLIRRSHIRHAMRGERIANPGRRQTWIFHQQRPLRIAGNEITAARAFAAILSVIAIAIEHPTQRRLFTAQADIDHADLTADRLSAIRQFKPKIVAINVLALLAGDIEQLQPAEFRIVRLFGPLRQDGRAAAAGYR